ncbi:type III secretion specific chlamydia chaperone 3 [Waddlia chondrophila 2032/99]|uniref:Type III secretion chaperone SycD/LcrH n=2 Tax=Waddlia chondrophila TaxID=71667 RepID=D6YVD6_WADCW|nr:SycD/LcrH family type III secretion system chaperone [Waddlia chondrophila]ADI38097.1 type III secretion chaperone SycD/LcrH [Waddlia chondrophila WSU 86-1044]CCB91202.1 type III secretion specific chlamydia chaperone 3 [Waddlia chondrophila 2032/99]
MKDDDLGEFKIPKKIQKKLNDKEWLKKEFAKGRSAQEILEFSDETMAKFYHAAYHLLEHEKYTDAADAFLFLVTLNPKNPEFWLGLGMSTQMCGNFEDAIDAYEMVAFYKPDDPVPYFYLAKCLFAVNERENALQALDLAVEYASDSAEFADLKKQAIQARNLIRGYE